MSLELLRAAALLWAAAAILALTGRLLGLGRALLALGGLAGIAAALAGLPAGMPSTILPFRIGGEQVEFLLKPEALWLMGFGLAPAVLACAIGTPSQVGHAGWQFGAASSLLGALGVFGLQHGGAMLVSWELMSLGGAVMILSERLEPSRGRAVLFMLALLEVGAVALILAVLLLGRSTSTLAVSGYAANGAALSSSAQLVIGILLVLGFGAKLGLLPFYEWFPGAYGSGSGTSGTIISGVVLNAAFFALARGLMDWLPPEMMAGVPVLAMIVIALAAISAVLTILYAFQEDDWRGLLSFSSAENASIAVTALGAAMIFRAYDLPDLAGLAWIVSLLHLAGHALAKGAMFLAADGLRSGTGSYGIRAGATNVPVLLGVGALFAAMSLAAMPPQAGFVSEWFIFQTVFQGFHLPTLSGRLILALTGAALALTAAVAFATFVKLLGIGVLGRRRSASGRVPRRYSASVGLLGAGVLALAVGMPLWLRALDDTARAHFGAAIAGRMHDGPILVPLTAKFAFISPTLLAVVMPLLALLPLALLLTSHRYAIRRAPVWYGGLQPAPDRAATTALTFSNAMRTFYSFIYRPTADTERVADKGGYFVTRLVFEHDVAPLFGPVLFEPALRLVRHMANRFRILQSGHLNSYLGMIGVLLVLVLALALA